MAAVAAGAGRWALERDVLNQSWICIWLCFRDYDISIPAKWICESGRGEGGLGSAGGEGAAGGKVLRPPLAFAGNTLPLLSKRC